MLVLPPLWSLTPALLARLLLTLLLLKLVAVVLALVPALVPAQTRLAACRARSSPTLTPTP